MPPYATLVRNEEHRYGSRQHWSYIKPYYRTAYYSEYSTQYIRFAGLDILRLYVEVGERTVNTYCTEEQYKQQQHQQFK